MLKKILLGLAVLLLVLIVVIALQPAAFTITRQAVIAAPPATVFGHVNDFRQWQAWSPWAKLDPSCKNTYTGPESGVGAAFAWDGNQEVGSGSMTITESKPGERILIDLVFTRPMAAKNLAEFTFSPAEGGTRIQWSMSGVNGFMGKAFGLLMDMDAMVGGQFAEGLANLKARCETPAQP